MSLPVAAVHVLRKKRSERGVILLLGLACVFFWAAKYHPFLAVPRVIDDDARQHVYWTYAFQDRELFRDDLLTTFFSSPKIAPLGYQAIYFVAAQVLDPLLFSQLLSLFLLCLAVWLFYDLGRPLGGPRGSGFAAVLFLLYFLYSAAGGLPKSFAFPLLLGCLSLLRRGAFVGIAALLCIQSLLYPPTLLNSLALVGLSWWRSWRTTPGYSAWWQLVAIAVGVGLGGGMLLAVYTHTPRLSWGSLVTPEQARTMPEFSAQGRSAFYGSTFLQTLWNDRAGIGADRLVGFVGIIAAMVVLLPRARLVLPRMATDLLLTSLGLFAVAHLLLFKLHLPSRYVLYTLPLAALLIIAANGPATLHALLARWPGLQRAGQRCLGSRARCWALAGVLALAFVYLQNRYLAPLDPLTVTVDRTAMRLYHYVQTLPKDVLIAGHPWDLDNIPLFAHRKVLVNQELSLPYFTGYYAEVRQRLQDMLLAYYTDDAEELRRFVQHYGIDYILVNTQHFTPPFLGGAIYYEPFNTVVRQRLTVHPHFALLDPNVWQRVYTNGPYILVSFPQGND